jgi:hypothetical protein
MEPGAYEKLRQLGLPTPGHWVASEAQQIPRDLEWVYVRSSGDHELRGPRRTREVQYWVNNVLDRAALSSVQIDELVDTSAGCVLVKQDHIYAEFVAGHLSKLLRGGDFFARTFTLQPGHFASIATLRQLKPQPKMLKLLDGSLQEEKTRPSEYSLDKLHKLEGQLERWIDKIPTGHLVEVLFRTDGGVIFIDLKEYFWKMHFDTLFVANKDNDPVYEYDHGSDLSRSGISQTATTRMPITLCGQAALSHAITYALRDGTSAIYK